MERPLGGTVEIQNVFAGALARANVDNQPFDSTHGEPVGPVATLFFRESGSNAGTRGQSALLITTTGAEWSGVTRLAAISGNTCVPCGKTAYPPAVFRTTLNPCFDARLNRAFSSASVPS